MDRDRSQVDLPARSRRPHRRDSGVAARAAGLSPAALRHLLRSGGRQRAFASRKRGPRGSRGNTLRFSGLHGDRVPAGAFFAASTAASARRWRSVRVPICLFSGTPERDQQPSAPGPAPALLAHQQVAYRHAVCLPGAAEDDLSGGELARGNSTLHPSPGEAYAIRVLQRLANAALDQRRSWPTCPSDLPALRAISNCCMQIPRRPPSDLDETVQAGGPDHAVSSMLVEAGAHQNLYRAERQHRVSGGGR